MPIGTSGPVGKGTKQSALGSKVKVMQGRRQIWSRLRGVILKPRHSQSTWIE